MELKDMIELVNENKITIFKNELSDYNAPDVAALMEELSEEKQLLVFRVLPKDLSAEVFAYLSPETQESIVRAISDKEVKQVMEELYLDDAVDFLDEMPANVVKKVLKNVNPDTREQITEFLKYPKNSAGSLMTVEFIELHDRLTAEEALQTIRLEGENMETVNTVYTIDNTHHLTGTVRLFDLIKHDGSTRLQDIRDERVVSVTTGEDQENVAKDFQKYDLSEMPVVDGENRLVGLITIDDVVDVIEAEATEDMEKMAAITPNDKPYLDTSPFALYRQRILWLMILMVSATITGRIITGFEQVLSSCVALTAFIPMLMDTGGNCGAQSSVMVIRGLALDEIGLKDTPKVLFKELRVALMIGITLGAINFVRILVFENVGVVVAGVVSLSLCVTVLCAKLVGGTLPILAKTVHLDPAVMASPIITTLVDMVSLSVFFTFAKMILKI